MTRKVVASAIVVSLSSTTMADTTPTWAKSGFAPADMTEAAFVLSEETRRPDGCPKEAWIERTRKEGPNKDKYYWVLRDVDNESYYFRWVGAPKAVKPFTGKKRFNPKAAAGIDGQMIGKQALDQLEISKAILEGIKELMLNQNAVLLTLLEAAKRKDSK